ncbi:hypothetical protein KO02_19960 [Sphingobacterium sp. ML3W]|nr:hypothetical protein KO02_19960 [Sphingobacterium sp. ML3W]
MYDIDYFKRELSIGNFFFVPVYYEGILLYNNANSKLVEPTPLSIEQIRINIESNYKFIANSKLIKK